MIEVAQRVTEALSVDKFARLPRVKEVAQRLGQPAEVLVLGLVAIFAVLCQLPIVGGALSGAVCFLCPAIETVTAIEQNNAAEFDRLLLYWFVFGTLHYFRLIQRILFWWMPGYDFLRLIFLMSIYLPKANGGRALLGRAKALVAGREKEIAALLEVGRKRVVSLCGVIANKQ